MTTIEQLRYDGTEQLELQKRIDDSKALAVETAPVQAQPLKFRHELKYYINFHQYFIIRQRLSSFMARDKHAGPTGEYHIRSLYFDDAENKALADKQGGLRDRSKYRIRIYNVSDSIIHFEKKIKKDEYIAKVKTSLTRAEADAIIAGDFDCLNVPSNPLRAELHKEMSQRLLRPKVIVDYVREPFINVHGNVRITFDKQLRTGLYSTDLFNPNLSTINTLDDNQIILEVKFDEYLPYHIRDALQLEGLIRQSASKYVMCRKFLKLNSWEDQ
ncbi:VTC domain-containing protein [Paenibacillus cellulosilyticus]|uniref:VTC domain-containing protein n=1 Tax=Paenibacillus cellulosilyticus TaxID=375489 RepID=A0A2V2YEG2_9BACL|nr:polyphosphate polymerase domain-containing protein [Paenibacillus cellulosilyticus]PWV90980.1 VTC domain-containing protein [Paenibacillus cellulosilyticus]QKS45197.1 polyphosphate polymerase domain-containing protein [Paenibacillus cellulosilyticus]